MGANVADFSVIHLGSFTVDVDGLDSVRMNFQFRDGLLRDLDGIVMFMIRRSDDLRLRVDINNEVVLEEAIVDGNFERLFQKVFPMKAIRLSGVLGGVGGQQVATFTATSGRGTFSDVVVWYRRNSE